MTRPHSEARVYMVTLTIPHREERGEAERLLDEAWRALRKYAAPGHWSRSCLSVLEWTPGRDGRGHPHVHVVVVARWLDYSHVYATWREACESVGAGTPARAAQRITSQGRKRAAHRAARYVAKYVAKTSTRRYKVEEWARLAAYQIGRRTVRASRGWWHYERPVCACCEQRHVWIGPAGGRNWAAHRAALHGGHWMADVREATGPPAESREAATARSDASRAVRAQVAAWRPAPPPGEIW